MPDDLAAPYGRPRRTRHPSSRPGTGHLLDASPTTHAADDGGRKADP